MNVTPKEIAAVVILTLAALGVRMVGTGFGLPHMTEMDSEITTQVDHLRGKELRSKSVREYYGTYPMLIAVATWVGTSPMVPDRPDEELSLDEHLRIASDNDLDTRRTVAFLSCLLVPLTWLLARRFAGPRWALYGAALAGANLLHVFFSQEARPHGPAAAGFALAMLAMLRVRRRPTTGSYVLAGVALALLLGILQSGIAMFIPLVVAHLLRDDGWRRALRDARILIPPVIVALTIPVSYWPLFDPEFRDVGKTVEDTTVTVPGHVIDVRRFNGGGLETTLTTLRSYEPALTLLVIVALAVWLVSRSRRWGGAPRPHARDALVVLAFVVPYLSAISLWEENYERFLIPLVPFFAVFVAWAASAWTGRLRGAARTAVAALFVIALGLPVYSSSRLAWIRHRPDTAEQAAEWVRQNVPPEAVSVFVTPWWDLPLPRTQESLRDKTGGRAFHLSDWKRYQARREPEQIPSPKWPVYTMVVVSTFDGQSVEGLREYLDFFGPGYYVVDAKKRGHPWMKWMSDELAARGELVARISPDRDPWAWNYPLFDQDGVEPDWPDFTPRVLNAVAIGPVIEIYRVDAAPDAGR